MSTVEENMRLMQTLDDAWNTQDWAVFEKRHAKEVDVFWPGQLGQPMAGDPTKKRPLHSSKHSLITRLGTGRAKIFFGQGDYTCLVRRFYRNIQRYR